MMIKNNNILRNLTMFMEKKLSSRNLESKIHIAQNFLTLNNSYDNIFKHLSPKIIIFRDVIYEKHNSQELNKKTCSKHVLTLYMLSTESML